MNRAKTALLSTCFASAVASASAAAPTIDFMLPAGGEAGTTVTLKVGGKLKPWPVRFWSDTEGLVFEPQAEEGVVKLQITDKAPPGPHLVRAYNDDGASRARTVMIGRLREIAETGENDDFRTPHKIETTPVVVNGSLDPQGDVDSFAIDLKAGQWLVAKVDCYGIGSSTDPALHLRSADGYRITEAMDSENLDPLLAWRAEADGTYILQISAFAHPPRFDIQLDGGPIAVYRLSIHTGAYARYTFPLAVRRGTKSTPALRGWNLGSEGPDPTAEIDATDVPPGSERLLFANGTARNPLNILLSDHPQEMEIEPNNGIESAQSLPCPSGVSGHIDPPGDADFYRLDLKQDETVKFTLRSASLGFPLDPVLSIWSDGRQVAEADDAGALLDPVLTWKAPSAGAYVVRVTDRFGKGGEDHAYHLEASSPRPLIRGAVDKDVHTVEAGTTATLKLNVTRVDGYDHPVVATAVDLPAGVRCTSAEASDKGGEITLILSAAPDAKAFSGLFRVLMLSTDPGHPQVMPAEAPLDLELPVGRQIIEGTGGLWLTVIPKPAPTPETESK